MKGKKAKKKSAAVGRPPTHVSEWAHRFSYTPPPAIEKGEASEETKWTPLLPTKRRQWLRATRKGGKAAQRAKRGSKGK
jgi:hypothetical protein